MPCCSYDCVAEGANPLSIYSTKTVPATQGYLNCVGALMASWIAPVYAERLEVGVDADWVMRAPQPFTAMMVVSIGSSPASLTCDCDSITLMSPTTNSS